MAHPWIAGAGIVSLLSGAAINTNGDAVATDGTANSFTDGVDVRNDNGEGFNLNSVKNKMGGSGLKNMQARAELLNGTFEIQSKIGKGTSIKIEIPK